jgi:hypothetical protein
LTPFISTHPLRVTGFLLSKAGRFQVVISNLQPGLQEIHLDGLPQGEARLWRLNQDTMPISAIDADAFLDSAQPFMTHADGSRLLLEPYESAFLEIQPA